MEASTQAGNGGTYMCAIEDYTNVMPAYATFDLSLGYNTLDAPANEYLRNIGVQVVVQNVLDKHGQYQYRLGAAAETPARATFRRVSRAVPSRSSSPSNGDSVTG